MTFWMDVSTAEWRDGCVYCVYQLPEGYASCCFIERICHHFRIWLILGKSNGHFT